MGKLSNIQWTDATWNIARGCTKVDADCKFCYMYRDSYDNSRYDPLQVIRTKTVFDLPLRYPETKSKCWEGRPLLFTSSLTDFFHPAIDSYRLEAWEIIRKCPHLIFQILTKRPERIAANLPEYWNEIRERVWVGTSIGSQDSIQRFHDLCDADLLETLQFLSLEPLHGPVLLPKGLLKFHIDWVIIGGESGNNVGKYLYRPCEIEWMESLVDQCKLVDVPVFVKQMGTHIAKELKMSDRHGSNIAEFPQKLQHREFPKNWI